jgi:hypothetical protein
MVNNVFKAVYNPFNRQLAVLYGTTITENYFIETEEWTKVSFNGDDNHPNYLHIQIDYDECFELLFYPREDNDSSLHEDLGVYFYSSNMDKIPENIKLVYNDLEYNNEVNKLKVK